MTIIAGSIPACAGEPEPDPALSDPPKVYPRVCGGTARARYCPNLIGGLSPRVRGNHSSDELPAHSRGSIPACAGEPGRLERLCRWCGVYPRVCGGTASRSGRWKSSYGLSPRVRGNQSHTAPRVPSRRSIPACAGEPASVVPVGVAARVYPRVCGGTVSAPSIVDDTLGLSPRVRGNLTRREVRFSMTGSIPACAGEPCAGSVESRT